jgi:ABC-type sugar transport system ATPase subunit
MEEKTIVEFKNLSKRFFGIKALENISFNIMENEIHAIVGENGAGKSTLIKVLGGVYNDYSGEVLINGNVVKIINPKISSDLGIRVVYQEFPLCDNLDVAGNIFLGPDLIKNKFGFLNWEAMYEEADKKLKALGIVMDVRTKVRDLSLAMRQIVEIVKAVSRKAKIIIMDEPTSALSATEVSFLFKLINNLKNNGITVIFISHFLEEVFKIADSITVLRDGHYINTLEKKKTSISEVVSLMIGKKDTFLYKKEEDYSIETNILELKRIKTKEVLEGVSFNLKKGEILGLAGLIGSGTEDVLKILFGTKKFDGEIYLDGLEFNPTIPLNSISRGIGFIPSDRRQEGLAINANIIRNIAFPFLIKNLKRKIIDSNKLVNKVEELVKELEIKIKSIDQPVKSLSGGNQQKVVIAKWLASNPRILLMDNPTRGVDIGARSEIYSILDELSKNGISIIITSTELEDVINLSDRVIVFYKGKIVKELKREEINKNALLLYCTSGDTEAKLI